MAVIAVASAAPYSGAQEIAIERPGDREFVRDRAYMIDDADEIRISEISDALLTDQAIPIIVVSIESMEQYGGAGMRIETFALLLFNQWEIGPKTVGGETWNKGILVLVSRDDRMARIELGDGWGREQDAACQQIMDEQIITRFKRGNFSAGVLAGVEALDSMARGESLPRPPISWGRVLTIAGFFGLMAFTFASLIRRGASGWAWLFWGGVFSVTGYILYNAIRNSGGGGGGFSGGSFGGGFSGGGGATGSW
jgi:uncharacterized protein